MTPTRELDAARDNLEFDRSLIAAIQAVSPDGILVVNDRDVIVSHNQRLFDRFGIAPGDAVAEDALKRADVVLYEAEGARRNRTMLAAGAGMT